MKTYQYSWTNMSAGVDCAVNIQASSREIANKVYKKKFGEWFKNIDKELRENDFISCIVLEDEYKHPEKYYRGVPILNEKGEEI